jgi:hypothetical protein
MKMDLSQKHFEKTAVHAASMAKGHHAIVATIRKALGIKKGAKADLGDLDVESLVEALEEVLEHLSGMGDASGSYAEHCQACAKEAADAEKAAGDAMNKAASGVAPTALEEAVRRTFLKMYGNTLMPTAVSAVAPNRPGLTAVPRFGAPSPAVPDVPLEFQKLVSVDDNDELAAWRQ